MARGRQVTACYKIPWAVIVFLAWAGLFAISGAQRLAPASDWMVVTSVKVSDTVVNVAPAMKVDRTIKQVFEGRWIVDVEKLQPGGRFEQVCSLHGESVYSPDNDPPANLTLSWWADPVDCTPREPGRYRVETIWRVLLNGGLTKDIHVLSNIFTVT